MCMCLTIVVPGPPQGKGRARTVKRGNFVHSYTPEKTVLYENLIKTLAIEEMKKKEIDMMTGAVNIWIRAYFEIPKSTSKKRREEMINFDILPCKKPDLDNIAKTVADALNGIVYNDDSQICEISMTKVYGEKPLLIICVDEIGDLDRTKGVCERH